MPQQASTTKPKVRKPPQAKKPQAAKPKPRIKNPTGSVAENFVPPKGTRKLFHARVWRAALFDQKTGKQIAKKQVRSFDPKEWDNFKTYATNIGWEYELLWDPTPYI